MDGKEEGREKEDSIEKGGAKPVCSISWTSVTQAKVTAGFEPFKALVVTMRT